MIPNFLPFAIFMRTILTCALLVIALCTGCPNPDKPKPANTVETPPETSDLNEIIPYVEPLVPRKDPPEETLPAPETTGVTSAVREKYAAETIPSPPIGDLTAQMDQYVAKIGDALEDLEGSRKYLEDAADVVRDASALALIALAVGLAEEDSKYKQSAPNIIVAAKNLAAAQSLAAGQKAYDELKSSLTNSVAGQPLSWTTKIADLKPVMKSQPNLSSAVNRATNTEAKLDAALGSANAQLRVYAPLAALSVISQGGIPNVIETKKPQATAEWKKLSEEFRDAALHTHAAAYQYAQDKADGKEPSYAAFKTRFAVMMNSCDDCHQAFYPDAIGKTE